MHSSAYNNIPDEKITMLVWTCNTEIRWLYDKTIIRYGGRMCEPQRKTNIKIIWTPCEDMSIRRGYRLPSKSNLPVFTVVSIYLRALLCTAE